MFPSKISEAYPAPDWQYGYGLIMQSVIPSDNILGRFDFMARRSTLSHQETNHTSLLYFVCFHIQCWTNTLYTTLTFREIKKQLCGPVRFHYACLLPCRWQYRYVATMLPGFAKCVSWQVFGFHLTTPHILFWCTTAYNH